MPPRRAVPSASNSSKRQLQNTDGTSSVTRALKNTFDTLTDYENRGIVKAVGVFGVSSYS